MMSPSFLYNSSMVNNFVPSRLPIHNISLSFLLWRNITSNAKSNDDPCWLYDNGRLAFGDIDVSWGVWGNVWNDSANYHHISFNVFQIGAGNYVQIYFDGKALSTTPSYSGMPLTAGTLDIFRLSQFGNPVANYSWGGVFSDVLVHRRNLSQSEISDLANPSNVMLSGMLQEVTRKTYFVPPVTFRPSWYRRPVLIGGGLSCSR